MSKIQNRSDYSIPQAEIDSFFERTGAKTEDEKMKAVLTACFNSPAPGRAMKKKKGKERFVWKP